MHFVSQRIFPASECRAEHRVFHVPSGLCPGENGRERLRELELGARGGLHERTVFERYGESHDMEMRTLPRRRLLRGRRHLERFAQHVRMVENSPR